MNTVVTSREAILAVCREVAATEGLQTLNMRDVAQKCNVAVGSVYNYFPSKSDLVAATIQDIWRGVFHAGTSCQNSQSFSANVEWIFESVKKGTVDYPNFLLAHSMNFASGEKGKARQVMGEYFGHMKAGLLVSLEQDDRVLATAFTEDFTKADFVDFVFSSLLTMLVKQKSSCTILTKIIERTIY